MSSPAELPAPAAGLAAAAGLAPGTGCGPTTGATCGSTNACPQSHVVDPAGDSSPHWGQTTQPAPGGDPPTAGVAGIGGGAATGMEGGGATGMGGGGAIGAGAGFVANTYPQSHNARSSSDCRLHLGHSFTNTNSLRGWIGGTPRTFAPLRAATCPAVDCR
jgi:hypothetical protein